MNLYGGDVWAERQLHCHHRQPAGTGQALSFRGFLQADYHGRNSLVLTRFSLVNRPGEAAATDKETFTGIFPCLQLWLFERAKLSFEYGLLNRERFSYGAVQVEVAF